MCNWKKWIWPGILAVVLLSALALLMKSGSIEQDLKAKALDSLSGSHKWASVALDGRDLTLSGTAPTEESAAEALDLAANAYDVRIARSVVELLPVADPYVFSAAKADNKITLEGNAPNEEARIAILDAAKALEGEVVDNLVLSRGAPAGFGDLADFAIGQLKGMTSGSVSTNGLDLSVTGEVADMASYDAIEAALAGAIPGGGKVVVNDVLTPPVSPYDFSASKSETGLVLEGHVPDEATRTILLTAAASATTGTVTDHLEIGRGAPSGFANLAGYAVNQLQQFSTGSVSLSDLDLAVRGTAASVEAYDIATANLAGPVPSGGKVTLADVSRNTVSPFTFNAIRDEGSVVLQGYVGSSDEKAALVTFATTQNPGDKIIDRLVVANGIPDGINWVDAGKFAIEQASGLSRGSATLNDGKYNVTGVANDNAAYDQLTAEVTAALPGGLTLEKADITRPIVSPYVWSFVNMEGGQPTLSGYSPDEALIKANIEQVSASVGTANPIAGSVEIGAGAPREFAAATSIAINTASRLLNGKAEINGTNVMVSGEALNQDAADEVAARVENGLPPGFIGKHAITIRPVEAEPVLQALDCQALLSRYMETNSIHFETDKAQIQLESLGLVDRLAFAARRCPTTDIEISGHTDSDGSDEYNQTLSEDRANSVRSAMIAAGVFAGRLSAKGYGESNPVADNSTDEGKAQNRRIEFKVLN